MPDKKYVIPCVGNRQLELSRLDGGNLLIVIALERRVRTEVAHMVVEAADRVALGKALASLFPAGTRLPVIKDKLRVKRYTPVVRRVMKNRPSRAS